MALAISHLDSSSGFDVVWTEYHFPNTAFGCSFYVIELEPLKLWFSYERRRKPHLGLVAAAVSMRTRALKALHFSSVEPRLRYLVSSRTASQMLAVQKMTRGMNTSQSILSSIVVSSFLVVAGPV